jgi:hypothetical protein
LKTIEDYTGESIAHYEIENEDYLEILRDSEDGSYDWKKLIQESNLEDGTEDAW